MSKKRKSDRGLSDEEDALDTFDVIFEDLLENMVTSGVDPITLVHHIETYIANWQEQYE